MNVGKICRRRVVTVRDSDDLTAAAELMREHHVGYLIAVEGAAAGAPVKPVGVLTDRDIVVSVVARKADPASLRVGDVMTRNPILAEEGSSVTSALAEMRRNGVRRLPVVDRPGNLVGILALDDVLEAIVGELENVAGSIRNEQRIEGVLRP